MGFNNITASAHHYPLSGSNLIQDTTTLATGLFTRAAHHSYQQRQQGFKKRRSPSTLPHENRVSQYENQLPGKHLEFILQNIQRNQEIDSETLDNYLKTFPDPTVGISKIKDRPYKDLENRANRGNKAASEQLAKIDTALNLYLENKEKADMQAQAAFQEQSFNILSWGKQLRGYVLGSKLPRLPFPSFNFLPNFGAEAASTNKRTSQHQTSSKDLEIPPESCGSSASVSPCQAKTPLDTPTFDPFVYDGEVKVKDDRLSFKTVKKSSGDVLRISTKKAKKVLAEVPTLTTFRPSSDDNSFKERIELIDYEKDKIWLLLGAHRYKETIDQFNTFIKNVKNPEEFLFIIEGATMGKRALNIFEGAAITDPEQRYFFQVAKAVGIPVLDSYPSFRTYQVVTAYLDKNPFHRDQIIYVLLKDLLRLFSSSYQPTLENVIDHLIIEEQWPLQRQELKDIFFKMDEKVKWCEDL